MLKLLKKTTPIPELIVNHEVQAKLNLDPIIAALNRQQIDFTNLDPEVSQIAALAKSTISQSDKSALVGAVDSSVNASNIQASIARAYSEVSNSEAEISTMSAAIEELTASISQISELARHTDEALANSSSKANQGASEVESAAISSKNVCDSLSLVDHDLANLNAVAGDIKSMAQEIDAIASQTNLLALNATIEAARAGEAGKGFAVVAQEVKSLSAQTAKSTESIRTRISRLENAINTIAKAVNSAKDAAIDAQNGARQASESVQNAAHEVSLGAESVANVAQVISEQTNAVNEMSEGIHRAAASAKQAKFLIEDSINIVSESEKAITAQLDNLEQIGVENYVLYRAKSDHILWKKRLAGLLCGLSSLQESELASHHVCRLGKWWNKLKEETPNPSANFLAIETPHKQVHDCGKEAARLYNLGQKSEAFDAFLRMEKASSEVVEKLNALIAENQSK